MTRFSHHASASVPANRRDAVNAELNRLLGCGPYTFSIPMLGRGGRVIRYGTTWRMTAEELAVLKTVLSRENNRGDLKERESFKSHVGRLNLKQSRRSRGRAV